MNRRNFLAIIPAISSIPIVGKAFEQDKEKIVIYQPEDIKHELPDAEYKSVRILAIDDLGNVLAIAHKWDCRPENYYIDSINSRGLPPMLIREELYVTAKMNLVEGVTYQQILKSMYK